MRRVAITGIGLVSPLGHSAAEVFEAACTGQSAIRRLGTEASQRLLAPLAATVDFEGSAHFDAPKLRLLDREIGRAHV